MAIQEVKVTFNKHDRDILISIDTSLKEIVKIERDNLYLKQQIQNPYMNTLFGNPPKPSCCSDFI